MVSTHEYMKRHRGFSLVELLVVIGVISVLAGLILAAGAAVVERSEVKRAENMLALLDTAMSEWEKTSGRTLTWGTDGEPPGSHYDLQAEPADMPEILVISEVLQTIERSTEVRAVLAKFKDEALYRYEAGEYPDWIDAPIEKNVMDDRFDGALTILDPWGTPIYATHPGRIHNPDLFQEDAGRPPNPDGTVQTYNEEIYGVTVNRRMAFVSAGPDRAFGNMWAIPGTELYEQTLDNIFSYPVERPE